ncbi:MAG: NUDIX domain-containing protein, partial [Pseudomonadota bacterium]
MAENGKKFEILRKFTQYRGFFNLERYRLRHTLYRGGWSDVLERELFERGSCVAVLLYDPVMDAVVLLEQFRVGAIKAGRGAWLLEIVAGAVEKGENATEVAYREAQEEAGCEILELRRIFKFYTSPGGASEKITLFCGKVDANGVGGIHGLEHEGEDILVSVVSADEAISKVNEGQIESAIPIIALQWLA